ncbi:retrovirus-related pol polyprotein from transposon TNT 1-94 [Tanacetum coccineum]
MAFLTVVTSSRFPSTNNQLRTSSNPRNQATIQDGRVTVQQVQGRQGQSYAGTGYKGNATSFGGNNQVDRQRLLNATIAKVKDMARQFIQPKRPRNVAWFKEKAMLAKAQESSQILDETEDLDAYDSNYDDVLNAKAVLMANLSSYGFDVILEVPHSEPYHNDMVDQSVHTIQDFEQTPIGDFSDNKITSDSNIILYFQYLQETQQAVVQDAHLYAQQDSMILSVIEKISREKMIDSQIDDIIKEKLALKQQIDSLEQNISNLIKEKESLLQTFIVFKNESKEKENFGKHFVPQQELSVEQAFWFQMSNPITESSDASPVKVEVPCEIPKVRLVNASLKKLKFHLSKFDYVVKIRTAPDALTEENDRLLPKIISQDVLLSVMNSITLNGESKVEKQRSESCDKCFDLDAEFSKTQNAYNDLLKSYSQLEKCCISLELSIQLNQEIFQKDKSCANQNALEILEYFKNNDLKAQLQAKDTTISKLKEHIKSMRENNKEEKVKQDMDEIETINIELEHKHSESLILQLNSKSVENADLKAQIQDKVFVITSLKNNLRKLKGKEIVHNVVQIPIATTIAPHMFKFDIEPLSHRLKNNRDAHDDYIKKTIDNTDNIHRLVERARQQNPSEPLLDSVFWFTKHVQELLVYVSKTCPCLPKLSKKLAVVTSINKVKKVRISEPLTSSSNIEQLAKDGLARGITKLKFQKDHLCSACALGKSKKSSHQPKAKDINQEKLYHIHMDLCGPIRVESINEKKYILVIVDDYSRFTWVKFLRSKDEAPNAIIKYIKNIQVRLNATVCNVRTDNGTEFVNQTPREYYENVGISHQTSVSRTP